MKDFIQNTLTKIGEVTELEYVDENWGQLDNYSPNMPNKWPCALVDIQSGNYSDIGRDRTQTPQNRQLVELIVEIRVAHLRLGNTSANAPQTQKDAVWSIWDIIDNIHGKVHGFKPLQTSSALIRKSHGRVIREDGVQEYIILYSCQLTGT